MTDPTQLPADLPEPEDDGVARHLPGLAMPPVALASTAGTTIRLDELGGGRTVLYLYPMTGRPGEALPDGWDAIPGARGCTPEAGGETRYRRLTLIITAGTIEHVFYPIFPPDGHAGEVLRWLRCDRPTI